MPVKKVCIALSACALFIGCGSQGEKKESTPAGNTTTASNNSSNPDYQKGLQLVANSDCLTCHKVAEKLTGPAYQDIAAKYEATDENIEMLAGKIIKGGQGVWGQIPMTAHPQLSEEDARQMVKYIFLLKKAP
jgi:cytochrome c